MDARQSISAFLPAKPDASLSCEGEREDRCNGDCSSSRIRRQPHLVRLERPEERTHKRERRVLASLHGAGTDGGCSGSKKGEARRDRGQEDVRDSQADSLGGSVGEGVGCGGELHGGSLKAAFLPGIWRTRVSRLTTV